MKKLKSHLIKSPVGRLKLISNEIKLLAVLWENEKPNRVKLNEIEEVKDHPILLQAEAQMQQYFEGQRKSFDLPIEAAGTKFQKDVWEVLLQIPFGTTWTYKQVAAKVNNPLAVRAVGSAIGRNPLSIIIPCHRVIASNNGLGGFAGGLDRKRILLDLEN